MEFFKPGRYFDFMSSRKLFMGVSLVLCVLSVIAIFWPGLNMGTDFKGGTEVEIAFQKPVEAGQLRAAVEKLGFGSPDIIRVQDPNMPHRFLIRVQEVSSIDEQQRAALEDALCFASRTGGQLPADRCPPAASPTEMKISPGGDKISLRYDNAPDLELIKKQLPTVRGIELRNLPNNPQLVSARDNKVEVQLKSKGDQVIDGLRTELGADVVPEAPLRVEWVGPKAGKQLRDAAIQSVVVSIIFIMAYIAFRFDVRFAPGAIVATIHDVLIVTGIFAISGKEFNLTTVAALLTIVGYSVNDTVVIFDRVRENLGKHRGKTFFDLINLSASETLARTILTSGTTMVSLVAFLTFGTGAIKDFAFALLIGMIAGTYSTLFVASALTETIDRRFFSSSKARGMRKPAGRKRADAVV